MPRVRFEPSGEEIEIDETTTLREAAHLAGVRVNDRCGGNGACCNCIITVLEGQENVCPITHLEKALFFLKENDRLSCQCLISGDVTITPGIR